VALAAATVGCALAVALGVAAVAAWSAPSSGPARSHAQTMPQGAKPTYVRSGTDVTVSWTGTVLSGGTPADGYEVARYRTDTGVVAPTGAGCAGIVAATSCVDGGVPQGPWAYAVTPRRGPWRGSEGPRSTTFTVAAPTLSVAPSTVAAVPANLTATIAHFAGGSSVTFRLDGPAGPVLASTPSLVPAGGSGAVQVTIPAGTTDVAHTLVAVAGDGSTAAAPFTVAIPPQLTALEALDADADGKVDTVRATFDEPLAAYTAGTTPWTLSNVPSAGSLTAVDVSGPVATLTLTEGAGAASTAMGTFKVALATSPAGVRDANGNRTAFAATAPLDRAAPVRTSLELLDASGNGKVDRVTAGFSETVAGYTAASAPWTVSGVPSGGSLGSVAVSTSVATLTLTEGAGTADTAVGTMTVALGTNAAGIRDAAGNLSAFTAAAPDDRAMPVVASQRLLDVDLDARVDRVEVTFAGEPLAPYTAGTAGWSLTNVPSGGTLASVSVSGLVASLELQEGSGAVTTAVGTMKVALAATAGGIRDAADNRATVASVAPTDGARPVLQTMELRDSTLNGKVDRVVAVFSEPLVATTATAPWALSGVPSAGTLASVSRTSATVTLALTEGSGTASTAVGSMTVALAGSAVGVADAAGNQGAFAARAPDDKAGPVALTVTDTNGITDGRPEVGDTLVVTFSEPLVAAPATTTLTWVDPVGAGSDTLSISGITVGAASTGSDLHLSGDGTTAAFPGTVQLSPDRRVVTVAISGTCSGGGCTGLGTATTAATFGFAPATTLLDAGANPAAGTRATSLRLF
jgi:hypothetical protein